MRRATQFTAFIATAVTATLVLPLANAQTDGTARFPAVERELTGVRVQLDNDLFAGREQDRDYTGGMAVTVSGTAARDGLLSLDPLLARIDQAIGDRALDSAPAAVVYHARQAGLMAFTPGDIEAREAQSDDRPYASLLFLSNGRVHLDADERGAWSSTLTVGVLGLTLSEQLHGAVHDLVGSETPRGYGHQISAGGEPTARYTLARHRLWIADPTGRIDVKTTLQGSVGYLTETSAAVTVRIGRFDSPWWSFAPELTDYMAAPVPLGAQTRHQELYFFAGARIEARAYNAFLQGQLRESAVKYSYSQIEPVVAEAWIGVVTQVFEHTELSYTLRYQTAELRHGRAARDALWGGVQVVHVF